VTDRRSALPLAAAVIGLGGSLAVTITLYAVALHTLDRALEERLRGVGESAAALFARPGDPPSQESLADIMRADALEAAYVVNGGLRVVADATGPAGRRADLLRVDVGRVRGALAGQPSIAFGYSIDSVRILSGYFPVRNGAGVTDSVLVLEAGQPFMAPRVGIVRARNLGILLSVVCALGLAAVALRSSNAERRAREAATRAARGEALSRVAAMAAHEIRNPLGVIRGTIDLMRERSVQSLSERDRRALDDVVHEVERLRRLTQDLLDLGADRPLAKSELSLAELLIEVARATEAAHPAIHVTCEIGELPSIEADRARLRQVFANLLANAAQAQGRGDVRLHAAARRGEIRVEVEDHGPGIAPGDRGQLFDLYFTTKSFGTGLGLAIARRFVEQHGGTLVHLADRKPGAVFEVKLPTREVT
jgi:two-component system OmpR family sensor kinase